MIRTSRVPRRRPRRPAVGVAGVALLALVAAGCGDDADEPEVEPTEEVDDDGDLDDGAGADEDGADADAGADDAADGAPTDGDAEPVAFDVDLEERHQDGHVVRVSRVEVTDLAVLVDIVVIVAGDDDYIFLNNRDPAVLVDDAGETYELVAPEDNPELLLDSGERLEGTLSFQGPLRGSATSIQLVFNGDSDPEGTSVNDRIEPNITLPVIELPS